MPSSGKAFRHVLSWERHYRKRTRIYFSFPGESLLWSGGYKVMDNCTEMSFCDDESMRCVPDPMLWRLK